MISFDAGSVPPITYGNGRLANTPDIVAGLGGGPVLVIADKILAGLGVTDTLSSALNIAGIAVEMAAGIAGEPKEALADTLADRARQSGCRVVIGLGGGAAMDCAKLVAAIAGANRPAAEYALSARPVPQDRLPAIAIPTTAGTGSEVTRTAIVSNAEGHKLWYWDEGLMFAHAILDPELTVTLPANMTAWTGIDAVAHALEAVTAKTTNPVGVLFGHQALRILSGALPRAVADGADLEARGQMLWASTVAGLALHNCNTHMGHNISHALGSLAPVHHGHATGLALEIALPWLVERPEGADLYAQAAAALGGEAKAADLPNRFAALMRAAGIPRNLPAVAAHVDAAELTAMMRAPANHSMSQNAICPVDDDGLEAMARALTSLPQAAQAA